jgi:hypothetical protein
MENEAVQILAASVFKQVRHSAFQSLGQLLDRFQCDVLLAEFQTMKSRITDACLPGELRVREVATSFAEKCTKLLCQSLCHNRNGADCSSHKRDFCFPTSTRISTVLCQPEMEHRMAEADSVEQEQGDKTPFGATPRPWWNRELWPDPTVAQLERRKSIYGKLLASGLCASLLLLTIGWLVEGKQKDQVVFGLPSELVLGIPQQQQNNSLFSWVWRIAPSGPFGTCGAVTLVATILLAARGPSFDSQIEKARKRESSATQNNTPT